MDNIFNFYYKDKISYIIYKYIKECYYLNNTNKLINMLYDIIGAENILSNTIQIDNNNNKREFIYCDNCYNILQALIRELKLKYYCLNNINNSIKFIKNIINNKYRTQYINNNINQLIDIKKCNIIRKLDTQDMTNMTNMTNMNNITNKITELKSMYNEYNRELQILTIKKQEIFAYKLRCIKNISYIIKNINRNDTLNYIAQITSIILLVSNILSINTSPAITYIIRYANIRSSINNIVLEDDKYKYICVLKEYIKCLKENIITNIGINKYTNILLNCLKI